MSETLDTRLLENTAAPALVVAAELMRVLGPEWVTWDYAALREVLSHELGAPVSEAVLSRIAALGVVISKDTFWQYWEMFHFLAQALNGEVPDFRNHVELTLGEMMLAVRIATSLRKSLGKLSHLPEFSEEVAGYVAARALHEGVWYLPSPLAFAAAQARGDSYRCSDCGADLPVMEHDGLCDICTDRFDVSSLGAWTPDPDLVARGKGKNIKYYEKRPTEKVKKRYEALLEDEHQVLEETPEDICVAKLLAARDYASTALGEELA